MSASTSGSIAPNGERVGLGEKRASTSPVRRVVFVDVLRLLALLQMVNGHTLDAVMAEHLRSGPVFERYVGFRGWVSVAFMLAAGLAYHLTTFARFDAYLADTGGRARRARRAAMIVGLGFLLRFPFDAFGSDPVRAETALANLVRVDVLHAIGLSILLLEGISSLARTPWMARAVAGVAGISLIALAPLGQEASELGVHTAWSNWLGHGGGSPFPIVPWGAYVLLGAALGEWLIPTYAASRAEPPWRLLLASLVTALVAMVALGLPGGDARHHASAPWFVLQKLAIVLGGLAIVAHLSREATRLPRWLAVLAGETLTLYVVHLLVLYWFPFSPHRVIGHTLPLHLAALVSLGMIALSIAVGLGAGPVRTRLARLIARNRDRVGVGFAADERARTARTDAGGADVERPGPRPSAV